MKAPGIKQRLQAATTADEAQKLLREGKAFKQASPGTQRKWARIADKLVKP